MTAPDPAVRGFHVPDLRRLFDLELHGPDTFVGIGPAYPWGRVYGGQVVAQALRAAQRTVPDDVPVHSLHAYFILGGDEAEPIRFEVDRIRNGRSFLTRRVVARQSAGAILNLSCSFQRPEPEVDAQAVALPGDLPRPADLGDDPDGWTRVFRRRWAHREHRDARSAAWLRVVEDLGDDPALQACALAYLSDDLPTDAVRESHPSTRQGTGHHEQFVGASLDHIIWFHRPGRADRWHLHDFRGGGMVGGRGLGTGAVFAEDGTHVATVAQEVLMRIRRS